MLAKPAVSFHQPRALPTGKCSLAHPFVRPLLTSAVLQLDTSRSLRRTYLEWVEEQVESYKESISRGDLLALADDVVQELDITQGGQYQLTEILLATAVDRRIFRLLKLPTYRTWRLSGAWLPGPPGPDCAS